MALFTDTALLSLALRGGPRIESGLVLWVGFASTVELCRYDCQAIIRRNQSRPVLLVGES